MENKDTCPHCGANMLKWRPPIEAGWGTHAHYVCFNDECPYYIKGWEWMESQFDQKVSYRHRLDPKTNVTGPIPVWSPSALRDRIVAEDEE